MLPRHIIACILVFSSLNSLNSLNSTWPWRCSWNVNLGTVILVFWVRIVMQHTEVRIFHLHCLLAAQIWNSFGGLRIEILQLKIEITFSWSTFSFKSWPVNWQICQISPLTNIGLVLLGGRTTASLKFGKPWQNLVDLKITGRTLRRELVTDFFAK